MQLEDKLLQIDTESIRQKIMRFIKDCINKTKAEGVVLGISGGVDSATTAALSAISIGGHKVLGLYMPENETYNKEDHEHIETLVRSFQFELKTINITNILDALRKTIPDYWRRDKTSQGNLKARTRMLIWYYYANLENRIVVGSSDKSETMIGYFTKWGDAAADIAPIMDLYKTQVRQLALSLGIPKEIVHKPSSPALWPNQTAEKEIGLKYKTLDLILYGLEHFMPITTIASQLNLTIKTVKTIKKRWLEAEHKRQMPLAAKLFATSD
ncbi:MAG: NAD+ synthase [Candidatus Bathyarchaeota archaeon]|nr:MAG: NAD+ synthase [Candidatus Bathyarchaeota archaeon]